MDKRKFRKPGHASATNAAELGSEEAERGENGTRTRAQTAEEFLALHPDRRFPPEARSSQVVEQFENDKRGLQKALGHDRDGWRVEQWEKDERAVFRALLHSKNGKCPAGVDWRHLRDMPEAIFKLPLEIQAGFWAPHLRFCAHFIHAGGTMRQRALMEATFPACGWWWCREKESLKPDQWAGLRDASEILIANGIDPNSFDVASKAASYREQQHAALEWWCKYQHLQAYVEANSVRIDRWEGTPAEDDLLIMRLSRWSAAPKDPNCVGNHADTPYHRFLECPCGYSDNWTPRVAAAILYLFGLNKSPRLENEIHRAEGRKSELNKRRK